MTACESCGSPATARIAHPHLDGRPGFLIARPATSPNPHGTDVCADCAHRALDAMLIAGTSQA